MSADFASLDLSAALLRVVGELGYARPTPVQAAAIPPLLAGKDLVGRSKTGSGKTAAFALPVLQHVDLATRQVQALVLCPTRELCAQVTREVRTLGRRHAGLAVIELAGGKPIRPQIAALERGVHVAVGTPGRVLDHLRRGTLDTDWVRTAVLDEADRMLDMGFGPDVEAILRELPPPRQTVLFSATFPQEIEALGARHLRDPVQVTIDETGDDAPEIRQYRLDEEPDDRFLGLCWVLDRFPHESALVFCNYKTTVHEVVAALTAQGVSAGRLDGDLDQFHRDQAMARFRNGSVRVLVATDVAGRGLDIDGLDLVVNYEVSPQTEVYVHRIGRTGRAGRAGVAVSISKPAHDERFVGIEARTGARVERLTRDDDVGLAQLLERLAGPAPTETIQVSGGRRHKLRKGDLLGALTGEAGGLSGDEVGRIEIHDTFSYVAVARDRARHAVTQLNRGRIKGRRFAAKVVGEPPKGGRRDR